MTTALIVAGILLYLIGTVKAVRFNVRCERDRYAYRALKYPQVSREHPQLFQMIPSDYTFAWLKAFGWPIEYFGMSLIWVATYNLPESAAERKLRLILLEYEIEEKQKELNMTRPEAEYYVRLINSKQNGMIGM